MEFPSTVHPIKYEIGGYFFEVVSYSKLTNEQSKRIALAFYHTKKFKKKDKGKTFKIITTFDELSANLL